VRQQEQALPQLRGFRREVAAQTWEQQWCETRLQLQARYSHAVADGPSRTGTAQATAAATRHSPLAPTTPEVRMSRYTIPAQDPDLTVIVGWDNPLLTFFAQVFNASIADDDEACVLWIGTAPQAISTWRRSRLSSPAGPRSHPTS
jgi:hypothetical protein